MFLSCKCYLELSPKACKSEPMWFWRHSALNPSGPPCTNCWSLLACHTFLHLWRCQKRMVREQPDGLHVIDAWQEWRAAESAPAEVGVACEFVDGWSTSLARMPSWSFEKTFVQSGRTSWAGWTGVIGIVYDFVDKLFPMLLLGSLSPGLGVTGSHSLWNSEIQWSVTLPFFVLVFWFSKFVGQDEYQWWSLPVPAQANCRRWTGAEMKSFGWC